MLSRTVRRFLWFAALFTLLAGIGCSDDTPTPSRKLLVIGIDSADWRLLEPMLEEGRLPHLRAFRDESASGRMETLVPLQKSPILWASIFTGRRPEVHGIGGFVKGADQEITGAADWRAPALWDIAEASGLSSTVLGMWSTHPARPIAGTMVSDFLPYGHGRDRAADGLVFPDSLARDVLTKSVDPTALGWSSLARFLPEGTVDEAVRDYPRLIEELRQIYAADLGYFEVARWLAAEHPTDVFIFYQRGPDMISHRFWAYMEPEKTKRSIPDRERELFAEVVPRYYEFADELLGEVLSWFPVDHPAVVLSDHGFWGPRKSGSKGTHEHSKWGIFLVRSPYYQAGGDAGTIHIYDICPTMLSLIGLPASREMTGRILPDAMTELGLEIHGMLEAKRQEIESYQSLNPHGVTGAEVDPAVSAEIRRQLQSLGYIN